MLSKLLKYEFRATGRIMLPVYALLLVSCGGCMLKTVSGMKIAIIAYTKGLGGLQLPEGAEYAVNLLYKDYTAEQGDLLFAHFFQMEVVGVGQPCDLWQIKSREADADTD